jgi:hypothetical protein
MDIWTLTHGTDTRTLEGWGMSGSVISEPSFNAGRFTASIAGSMTASVPWAEKDSVIIKRGDVVEFRGTVLNIPRQGEGPNESIQFEAVDPWWWLGQASYTQSWWDKATLTAYEASRVALFAAVTAGTGWSLRSIGGEIAAIIAHCNTLHGGGKMQMGTLTGDGFAVAPTPQRLENVTHEGALRRAAQWVPDAVFWWDHSTDPPTLNGTQRATARARDYVFCDGVVMMSQQIKKRQDLVVTGVRIVYSGVDAFGNPTAIVDQAGATSGSGVVETVIDLTGGAGGGAPSAPSVQPAVEQKYTVESEAINLADPEFWFNNADLGVNSSADIVGIFGPVMEVDSTTGHTGLAGCNLKWVGGGIPKDDADTHTRRAWIRGLLSLHWVKNDGDDVTQDLYERRWVQILMSTTDLSGEHTHLVRDEFITMGGGAGGALGTMAPTGIAAQLLAAWSQPQYDGALRITRDECNEDVHLGDVVNWTGSLGEWTTMRAQVQQLTRNIDTGTTEITLGAADHLALDEFVKLLKISYVPALDLTQQAEGTTPTGDPDTTTINELVTPEETLCSVGRLVDIYRRYTSHKEYKFEGDEATTTLTDLDSDDKVTTAPASVTVENTSSADKTETTPAKTKHTNSDNDSHEGTPTGMKLTNASGDSLEITLARGIKMIKGTRTTWLDPEGGLTIEDSGKISGFNLLQMGHDDGAGKTNIITETEMEIIGDGKTGIYESSGVSFDDGSSSVSLNLTDVLQAVIDGDTLSAEPSAVRMESGSDVAQLAPGGGLRIEHDSDVTILDAAHLNIEIGDDSVDLSPAGGMEAIASGYTAEVSPSAGLHLEGPGGGMVDIATIDGKTISLMETSMCVDTDGDISSLMSYVLRNEAEAP